jgi:cytochrome c peroxidase
VSRPPTIACLSIAAALIACGGEAGPTPSPVDPDLPLTLAEALKIDLDQPPTYAITIWPAHYDAAVQERNNTPVGNPVTDAGALLGRVLFHDTRLSIDYSTSCATCHDQDNGFTDRDRFSEGVAGGERTAFHSMRLLNARFFTDGSMFWNRRAISLETQAIAPIESAIELGFDSTHGGVDSLLRRLNAQPYYRGLTARAFGDSALTSLRIGQAIAQFVRALVSIDSKFDRAFAPVYTLATPDRGVSLPFPGFTAEENRGKALFLSAPASRGAGCGSCHAAPTFALVGNSGGNGLDPGSDAFFKAPSLKSVAVTGPYMHDGRFPSLSRVIEFYDHEINEARSLDPRLRGPDGLPQRLNLSAADKRALVAFLRTLTDESIATDSRFSSPFRR